MTIGVSYTGHEIDDMMLRRRRGFLPMPSTSIFSGMGLHNEWTKDSNYMGTPVQALLTPLDSPRPTPPPTPVINNIIPTDIKTVKRAVIIGIGGVGANLAFSLAKEGYELALIDHDFIEQKNVNRFAFTSDDLSESVGKLKANVIEKILRKRDPSVKIEAIPQRFEDVIDSSRMQSFMARPFIAICCSDSKNSRQTIEKRLRKSPTCKFFVHVGCNLNSVSIYPTVEGILASEVNRNNSSYDHEPDVSTYLRCSSEVMSLISNNHITVQNDFVMQGATPSEMQNRNIAVETDSSEWFRATYNGRSFLAKRAKASLQMLVQSGMTFYVRPEMRRETPIFILSTPQGNVKLLKNDLMTTFSTPHTYTDDNHYQCTGNILKPRNGGDDLKRFINEVEASINIVNLNSVSNYFYGDLHIDSNFLQTYCTRNASNSIMGLRGRIL